MPTLSLKIAPHQNPERHTALGAALTHITAQVLRKNPDVTVVMVENLPATQYCIAGRGTAQTVACLEIRITAGTNSADEKAQFICQAYAELQRQLCADGSTLALASYVVVHELPASDWGYGGITQAERRAQRLATSAAP